MTRIALLSGSARAESLHLAILATVEALGEERNLEVDWLDLHAADLPIYHGDIEAADGPPGAAAALAARLASAGGLLIATPEYNGGPSGLLKNGIDWISRVDKTAFQGRPIGLLAASPGSKGARHGLDILDSILRWMQCDVYEVHFSLPGAREHVEGGRLVGVARTDLEAWLDGYVAALPAAGSDDAIRINP